MLRPLLIACLIATAPASALHAQDLEFNVIEQTLTLKKSDIVAAEAVLVEGAWAVSLAFGPEAAKSLAAITSRHLNKKMQIMIGDHVASTPVIRTAIMGGKVIITGSLDEAKAKELAARFK